MISRHRSDDDKFDRAVDLIDRSGVVQLLEDIAASRRGSGGRPAKGIQYTIKAVVVSLAYLIDLPTTPSLRNVLASLVCNFDDDRLRRLGMTITHAQRAAVQPLNQWNAEYRRFHLWLGRQVEGLDSGFDLPARRITNRDDAQLRAARTAEIQQAANQAADTCRVIMNKIVAASVLESHPAGYEGDIVVDESTFDVAKTNEDVGTRPTAKRPADYAAGFYRRSGGVIQADPDSGTKTKLDKMGFGVGVTAITRVGRPGALRSVVPVITAIDIHKPTAASREGFANALTQHRLNRFDPLHAGEGRRGRNTRWPYVTTDMGYNQLDGFAELLIAEQYAMIAAYPQHWHLVSQTQDPVSPTKHDRVDPGPMVGHGDVYCPAGALLLRQGPLVERTRSMADAGELVRHDQRLRSLLPLLMGTNSRPRTAGSTVGRPRRGQPKETAVKLDVVCPAVQGRVRCPLKPESMSVSPADVPTLEPTWSAHDYRSCANSQTTITFTPEQLKRYQAAFTPGSWEHILHFEAYRAITERQFSLLKSPSITHLDRVNFGPRREPMLKLIIALAVAISNLRMQDDPHLSEVDSVTERLRSLERVLGRPPARIPPRT
jgi:hypothetical protein